MTEEEQIPGEISFQEKGHESPGICKKKKKKQNFEIHALEKKQEEKAEGWSERRSAIKRPKENGTLPPTTMKRIAKKGENADKNYDETGGGWEKLNQRPKTTSGERSTGNDCRTSPAGRKRKWRERGRDRTMASGEGTRRKKRNPLSPDRTFAEKMENGSREDRK